MATRALAGTKLLTKQPSAKEQREADYAIWKDRQRRYDEWLSGLPISQTEQGLIRAIDRLRAVLLAGGGIDPKVAAALKVWNNRLKRTTRNNYLKDTVDFMHREMALPKSMLVSNGPSAFEEVGRLFADGLSAEQVRKIYYKRPAKKKLPRIQKRRQSSK